MFYNTYSAGNGAWKMKQNSGKRQDGRRETPGSGEYCQVPGLARTELENAVLVKAYEDLFFQW